MSSYGSVIPRAGWVALRYSAASAMKIGTSYAVIFPLYGEFASKVMPQLSGLGVTTSGLNIRKFTPYM